MFLQACNRQQVVLQLIYCILSVVDQQEVILITWFYDVQIRALVQPTNVLYVVTQSTVMKQDRSFQSEVVLGVVSLVPHAMSSLKITLESFML
jgi:hypothetical protein